MIDHGMRCRAYQDGQCMTTCLCYRPPGCTHPTPGIRIKAAPPTPPDVGAESNDERTEATRRGGSG